jgi:hypothetical protein
MQLVERVIQRVTRAGLGLGLAGLSLAGSASAQNLYALDDGQPNSGLSYGIPADYCWFQFFDTVGAVDSIVNVQVMFQPGGIPAGTPITLCVWEDPNDDGDPGDAQLLASRTCTRPSRCRRPRRCTARSSSGRS